MTTVWNYGRDVAYTVGENNAYCARMWHMHVNTAPLFMNTTCILLILKYVVVGNYTVHGAASCPN